MDNDKLQEAIETNNLKELVKNKPSFDNLDYNPLIQAIIYKSWDVAEYIVTQTNKYTNISDQYDHTALMYALKEKKYDFAMFLLDNGFNNFSQRNYQGKLAFDFIKDVDQITHEILVRMLPRNPIKGNSKTGFRIYEVGEMDLKPLGKSGTYGSIFYDKRGENVVKISNDRDSMSSFFHEAMILRMINIVNPELVVTLKGIKFKPNEISLVLEGLSYSLEDVFKVYNKIDISVKAPYFKELFYRLIDNVDKLHSMGILHRDLKPSNIMLTSSGHLKIIDLGIAEYVGILPTKIVFIGTPTYVAPDSNNIKRFILPNGDIILTPDTKRNYTSDIYSIGSIIVNSIFGTHLTLVFTDNDIYYYNDEPINKEIRLYILEQRYIDEINSFSPHLFNLLRKMLELDSSLRITAREALIHEFFNENRSNLNTSSSLTTSESRIAKSIRDGVCMTNLNLRISKIYEGFFSDDEIRFGRGPLKYGHDIYEFIKGYKIPKTNLSDIDLEELRENYGDFDANEAYYDKLQEFDLMFNCNLYISSVSKNTKEYLFQLFFGVVPETERKITMNDLQSSFRDIINSGIEIYPVSIGSYIEYYVTCMQRDNITSSTIMYFRGLAYNQFYELSYTKRDKEITVGDFMNHIIKDVTVAKEVMLPYI